MNLTKLSLELCKREGKKRGVNIADMREIVRCLVDIEIDTSGGVTEALELAAVKLILRDETAKKKKKPAKKGKKK